VEKEKERKKAYRAQVRIQAVQQRIERKSRTEQENAISRTYGYDWKKEMVEAYEDWEEAWVLHTPASAQMSPPDALQEIARLQVHKPGHPSTLWAYDLLSLAHPLVLILDTETTGIGSDAEIIDIALVDKDGQVYLNSLV
jgi:uncharacterized protein YprB with RNaseH-like and TPR domain